MGSESITHSAFGHMGCWANDENEREAIGERNQLVGQKYGDKTTLAS